jgi:hypothetical protein
VFVKKEERMIDISSFLIARAGDENEAIQNGW